MIIIGITGSIGMGKTTISSMLKFLNIPIFDSDKEVKRVLNNEKVIDKIQKIWPEVVSLKMEQKKIDKFSLSNKIFENKKNRKLLEGIIHPIIKEKRVKFINE